MSLASLVVLLLHWRILLCIRVPRAIAFEMSLQVVSRGETPLNSKMKLIVAGGCDITVWGLVAGHWFHFSSHISKHDATNETGCN